MPVSTECAAALLSFGYPSNIYNCCAIYLVINPFFALHSYCIGRIAIWSYWKWMSVGMNGSKWTNIYNIIIIYYDNNVIILW